MIINQIIKLHRGLTNHILLTFWSMRPRKITYKRLWSYPIHGGFGIVFGFYFSLFFGPFYYISKKWFEYSINNEQIIVIVLVIAAIYLVLDWGKKDRKEEYFLKFLKEKGIDTIERKYKYHELNKANCGKSLAITTLVFILTYTWLGFWGNLSLDNDILTEPESSKYETKQIKDENSKSNNKNLDSMYKSFKEAQSQKKTLYRK